MDDELAKRLAGDPDPQDGLLMHPAKHFGRLVGTPEYEQFERACANLHRIMKSWDDWFAAKNRRDHGGGD